MNTEEKLTYLATLVNLISVLYVDQNTDVALRQRAKEETEKVIDSLQNAIQ